MNSLVQKFWGYVMPDMLSECWLWIGGLNEFGYGTVNVNRCSVLAHRLSYTLYSGNIPPKLYVLHTCDVRCCVNPEHLFLGTQRDNVEDMERKKRSRHLKGQDHGHAVLTDFDVRLIREDTRSSRELAKVYGVDKATILSVKQRKTWRHLT